MKFNFRKIASVLASAVMISSTAALAVAATYPQPFVKNGMADVAVVWGSTSANTDLVAVTDITASLQAELAKQTATSGSSSGASASGGDSVNLASSSQNLYFSSALNAAKTSLTRSELPSLLADGTITDNTGTTYTYTQAITLGARNVTYGTSSGNLNDPTLYIDGGIDTSSPLYTYKLTMNKNINVSSSNVIGNDIMILGQKYTIGANSVVNSGSGNVLYLYGAGQQATINEGDETTVTVGNSTHTVKVTGVTQSGSTNQVYISVDGLSPQKINEGSASNIGGVQLYAKTVFYSGKTGSTNYAALNLGTNVLQLSNGQAAAIGTDAVNVQNSKVTLSQSGDKFSSLQLDIAMPDATKAYIPVGGKFVDTVLGGLAIQFADVNPALDSASRDMVTVDTDNSRNVRVTFQSALSTSAQQFNFLHDGRSDTSTGTPLLNLNMADTSNKTIHVKEGSAVFINEYAIINSGDYGRIIKLTSVPTGTLASTSTIQFQDVLTGENLFSGGGLTIGTSGNVSTNIDGQTYYFTVNNGSASSNVSITWGSNAQGGTAVGGGAVGSATTLFPRIKLKNGEWISFLKPTSITNATRYVLPGVEDLTTYESGVTYTISATDSTATSFSVGNVVYNVTGIDRSTNTTGLISGVYAGGSYVNFNSSFGGAILIQEEKKTTETGNSNNGDVIVIPVTTVGSTTVEVAVTTPKVTNTSSGFVSWTSNSNKQTAVDRYGTLIEYDTDNNHKVVVSYPDQQMLADVLFTAQGVTVTPGSTSGGTVKQLGSVVVQDSQVASVSDKNLIVVGGSCVNSVAADLLGVSSVTCGDDFTQKTGVGAGQYLIQSFSRSNGKVATLVAGFNAQDTTNGVAYLTTQSAVDTTAGKKYVGTSATVAQPVVTSN